jgi:hypothetical protein
MTSPALVLSGFAVTGPGPSDAINSVTAVVNCWISDAGTGPLAYELRDGTTGALIGTATGTASTSAAHYDTVTFPAPSWGQLFWLQLWIFASPGSAPPGTVASVDYAALSVAYVSSGIPFAAPVAQPAAAAATAPDATGPSGRIFTDVTVFAGPTLSRSLVLAAGLTISRSQVAAAGPVTGNGTKAGVVSDRAPLGAGV